MRCFGSEANRYLLNDLNGVIQELLIYRIVDLHIHMIYKCTLLELKSVPKTLLSG